MSIAEDECMSPLGFKIDHEIPNDLDAIYELEPGLLI
jgi:hypothetical protein